MDRTPEEDIIFNRGFFSLRTKGKGMPYFRAHPNPYEEGTKEYLLWEQGVYSHHFYADDLDGDEGEGEEE